MEDLRNSTFVEITFAPVSWLLVAVFAGGYIFIFIAVVIIK